MKNKKVRRTRTGTRLLYSLLAICAVMLSACSATQSIKVKQSQGEQIQETEIQHEGALQNLTLSFTNCPALVTNPLAYK